MTPSEHKPLSRSTSFETFLLSDRAVAEELGDRLGLLFTDAAHTVLCDIGRRRRSL